MAKYKIIPSTRTIVQSPISIGHKAEKGVEAIEFDLTAWVETYGSGTATIVMKRWGDAIPYPIALEIDENNKATWTLSDTDTAKAGMAYAQLSYIVGETVVKKSDIYTFRVMDSLTGEGEPPEAYESWLEHLTHFAAEAMAEVLDIEGIVTDKTLTVDGGIADGKATGDALSAIKADLSATKMQTALYNAMNLVTFRPVKPTRYQGNTTNNGITYEWHDDNTCTVSGAASSMSFNNIYSDTTHSPSWLKKGETYVFKGGTNVSLEVYVYKSGSYYYGLSVKSTEKEYTIPADIDGLIMRLQVANGVAVNETVLPVCRKKNVPSNTELYDLLTEYWADLEDLDERVTDIEAGGGGGSGGSSTLAGLTDTSISNKVDGQVLTYDNTSHKWVNKMPIGADNSLVVNVSGTGTYRTCDKTYAEIYNAISTGKTVVAVDGTGVVYPYAGLMEQNGKIVIALGISVVYNKTATLTGYLIVDMNDSTVAIRQDQSSSFYATSETYTRTEVNKYVSDRLNNYYTVRQINEKIGDIETLLAAI